MFLSARVWVKKLWKKCESVVIWTVGILVPEPNGGSVALKFSDLRVGLPSMMTLNGTYLTQFPNPTYYKLQTYLLFSSQKPS